MEPIRFAIAGTGYRATRYLRAALELPEFFTVTCLLYTSQTRPREPQASAPACPVGAHLFYSSSFISPE